MEEDQPNDVRVAARGDSIGDMTHVPERFGHVVQVSTSRGGVPKLPVSQAWISVARVEGDAQRDRRHHGGPDRAVCLDSAELIRALAAEGNPIAPGTVGENLTLEGIDWRTLGPGSVLEVGDAELEVTDFAAPCTTIRGSFADANSNRINEAKWTGWSRLYARVLREGVVKPGDDVRASAGPGTPKHPPLLPP